MVSFEKFALHCRKRARPKFPAGYNKCKLKKAPTVPKKIERPRKFPAEGDNTLNKVVSPDEKNEHLNVGRSAEAVAVVGREISNVLDPSSDQLNEQSTTTITSIAAGERENSKASFDPSPEGITGHNYEGSVNIVAVGVGKSKIYQNNLIPSPVHEINEQDSTAMIDTVGERGISENIRGPNLVEMKNGQHLRKSADVVGVVEREVRKSSFGREHLYQTNTKQLPKSSNGIDIVPNKKEADKIIKIYQEFEDHISRIKKNLDHGQIEHQHVFENDNDNDDDAISEANTEIIIYDSDDEKKFGFQSSNIPDKEKEILPIPTTELQMTTSQIQQPEALDEKLFEALPRRRARYDMAILEYVNSL